MVPSLSALLMDETVPFENKLRATELSSFDFRLLFANRVVDQSWREHKLQWTCEDIGVLLMELLEEEFNFDWSRREAVETFKSFLALAFVAAGDVLPPWQRAF